MSHCGKNDLNIKERSETMKDEIICNKLAIYTFVV